LHLYTREEKKGEYWCANGKGRERSLLLLESQIYVFLLKNLRYIEEFKVFYIYIYIYIYITGERHNKNNTDSLSYYEVLFSSKSIPK